MSQRTFQFRLRHSHTAADQATNADWILETLEGDFRILLDADAIRYIRETMALHLNT